MAVEFDSYFIKHGGITDEGLFSSRVMIGFAEPNSMERNDIEIDVAFAADINDTIASLRQRATDEAFIILKKAVELLKDNSAEDLHRIAQENDAAASAKRNEELKAQISGALGKS